jgi:hypothetical protein
MRNYHVMMMIFLVSLGSSNIMLLAQSSNSQTSELEILINFAQLLVANFLLIASVYFIVRFMFLNKTNNEASYDVFEN